jgi:hypothetical protein
LWLGRPERDGSAQGPEGAAIRVVGSRLVEPAALGRGREPVVEAAVRELGPLEESEAGCLELPQFERPPRLPHDDDERTSGVVGAVAVLSAGRRVQGVLEDAGLVAQP